MNQNTPISKILTLNAGSSSLRLASFSWAMNTSGNAEEHFKSIPVCTSEILTDYLDRHTLSTPEIVVHRIVHGGEKLFEPCVLDADVEAQIEQHQNMAPLHNDIALQWVRASREAFGPDVIQLAYFDSGFYKDLPDVASTYALPKILRQRHGLRRFGYHGIAHQSLLDQWRTHSDSDNRCRVISLQLGGGCSVTVSDHGKPIETSMGFSPLGGVMMGARCGDLDPEVVLHLIEQGGLSPSELRTVFYEQSGLLGVSGLSGDLKKLMNTQTPETTLAIAMFCQQLRGYIGAYFAILNGADAIVFGGGIGEHAPVIRERLLENFEWAGVRIDQERNFSKQVGVYHIHADDSAVEVWVIPTDEARVMADYVRITHSDGTTSAVTGIRKPV